MSESLKYLKWAKIEKKLKGLKKEEADMRRELCQELFDDQPGLRKIVKEIEGLKITANYKTTIKIDAEALKQIFVELSLEDEECIEYKPSLKKREYNKLSEGSLLYEVVTEKPSMPTLKVEEVSDGD